MCYLRFLCNYLWTLLAIFEWSFFFSVEQRKILRKSTSYTLNVHPKFKKFELLLKDSKRVKTQYLQYICCKWHAKKTITCQDTSKSSLCNNKMLSAFTNHKHVDWKSVQEFQFLIFNFILIAYFDHRAYDQLKQTATAAGRHHNSEGCYRQDLW